MFLEVMSRYLNSPREADWYACPTCGDEVRVGTAGCRKCVALPPVDERAWEDVCELPPDACDFEESDWQHDADPEAGEGIKPATLAWKYWFAGVVVLAALIWMTVFAGFIRH